MNNLFEKYDVPAPRYTSYPTVPYWEAAPSEEQWFDDLLDCSGRAGSTWSMYLHLPFCESRCAFCGCNTMWTSDHSLEKPYVEALCAELQLYLDRVPSLKKKPLRQLHLGGGSPTFFGSESLESLLSSLLTNITVDQENFDASVEVNPRFTSHEQLRVLSGFGFRRLSIGVQDFDEKVQEAVRRPQPPAMTSELADFARSIGFASVNFDLIFGLPFQTPQSMKATANRTIELRPDRIALYSLALVPWIKPAHKELAETAPRGPEKRALYELCRQSFLEAGYIEIGMDHFALPADSLARAAEDGNLHRNFMGYTDMRTDILVALGASAISQSPGCFHQNEKSPDVYREKVMGGHLATLKGHVLTVQDRVRQKQILDLMTRFRVEFESAEQESRVTEMLSPLIEDSLVAIRDGVLELTAKGRPFMRNACVAFDDRLRLNKPDTRIFSQSV